MLELVRPEAREFFENLRDGANIAVVDPDIEDFSEEKKPFAKKTVRLTLAKQLRLTKILTLILIHVPVF